MHATACALLLIGALAGGFVSGLSGFGTALMALGIWLYVLPPSHAVPLVLTCSVIAQTATLPSMWRSFDLTLVRPLVIGGLLGVPLGTMLVAHAEPRGFQTDRRRFPAGVSGRALFQQADGNHNRRQACGRRDRICRRHPRRTCGPLRPAPDSVGERQRLGKEERRGIFQIFNMAILFAALCLQAATGLVKREVIWLAALAFPATVLGS